jgi:hypothetical protein
MLMAVVLGITVLLATRIANLKVDMDPDVWAPQSHPFLQTTHAIENVFGGRNFSIIGIVPKQGDIYQPEILAKIKRIQAGIQAIPEAVQHNIISLAAPQVKAIRGTREGMEVRRLLDKIPQTPEEMARLKSDIAANPFYINTLVSPDGKTGAVIVDFAIDKKDPRYSKIDAAVRKVTDGERDDRVDIYLAGVTTELAWFERHMEKMPLWFGLALLIIMAIQYWSFRSFQGMLLPITTSLLSVVWALGLMALFDVHLDVMNTTTPILIMAVAAGHSVQILKRYYEEYNRLQEQHPQGVSSIQSSREAVINSMVKVGPAMITTGLIASISFLSLATSEISVVRHFGIFAGCGILAALILEMSFIPALRASLPAPKRRESERERLTGMLDRLLESLSRNLAGGRAPLILGVVLAVFAVVILGSLRLHADNSLRRYNSESSEVRKADAIVNERLAGSSSFLYLIEGKGQDSMKDPKVLDGIAKLQSFLESQPQVGKTQSIADLIKRMNQAMHADDPAYYVLPTQRDLIAQYLFLYSLSGEPDDFDNFVDNDYQKAVIWVYLNDDSTARATSLYEASQAVIAQNFPPDVTVSLGSGLSQTMAINEVLTHEKFGNMAQMAVAVFLLSAFALRSLIGGLFVVVPLVLIALVNFGLMGWFGLPLDMGTSTTAAMAIGIGADYELYLLFRFREELALRGNLYAATRESLLTSGKAILFVALSVAGGYSILLLSGFAFYSRLAVMVIATMMVSAVSALIFLRAMMIIFKPRFVFGDLRDVLFKAA